MRRLAAPFVLSLAACPQANQADPAAGKVAPTPVVDGRVISDGTDLYPAKGGVVPKPPPPTPPSPGTGLTDEGNGKCRLFAPEQPNPACCERDLGFDAAAVQTACDLKIYLGESFQGTCGYHFVADATKAGLPTRWLRMSVAPEKTPKEAAAAYDRRNRKIDNYVAAAPLAGVPGVYTAEADELHWAFLPGWKQVRMLTWSDESCSQAGIEEVIRQLVAATEVPAGTPRTALVPGGPPSPVPLGEPPAVPVAGASEAADNSAAPTKGSEAPAEAAKGSEAPAKAAEAPAKGSKAPVAGGT